MSAERLITDSMIEEYRSYIGSSQSAVQQTDAASLARFAVAAGRRADELFATVPPMMHWAYFLPAVATHDLGEDGHHRRGGFMPPLPCPGACSRGRTEFLSALKVGAVASCVTRIRDVTHRTGRSGELVFVEVERRIEQEVRTCLIESQTIVYRQAGGSPPVIPASTPLEGNVWQPNTVELFRFSAVTFNAHRIHYDQSYARDIEFYPDLVVQGPFTALKLCLLAYQGEERPMRSFSFNGQAPLFVGQPVRLRKEEVDDGYDLFADRCDGAIAMKAKAAF
ncbi:acyl-CoA dehydrogenase [Microvirga aerilata]|uniref:acyl-CoA dehydrogenase n=1 Tax=Microvirga aerilata TaxID=670292 RepID=UPI00362D6E50